MTTAASICSAERSMLIGIGFIGWGAAELTSLIRASASTHFGDAIQPANRCCVSLHTLVPQDHSKANHECSTNAETLSRRRQKSVQLTLKLAPLLLNRGSENTPQVEPAA